MGEGSHSERLAHVNRGRNIHRGECRHVNPNSMSADDGETPTGLYITTGFNAMSAVIGYFACLDSCH